MASNISWYPGHMHKAREHIGLAMKAVQLVVEILDARCPFSSENPFVGELRGDTPILKVLNKSDLADPRITRKWIRFFEKDPTVRAIDIMATRPQMSHRALAKGRPMLQKPKQGLNSTIMVLGIPNVGKSSFINSLVRRGVCKTGNIPAVTRQQQIIKLSDKVNLIDTPGFLWPKLSPEECAQRLAITGSISDKAFEYEDCGEFLAEYLLETKPGVFAERYGVNQDPFDVEEAIKIVAESRGCLLKGGRLNLERAAEILIRDYRDGKFGRITLETPEMVQKEGGYNMKALGLLQRKTRLQMQGKVRKPRKRND